MHEAIIFDSFRWDEEHMYSFFFDNIPYSKNRRKEYSCNPEPFPADESANSSDIELRKLSLKKNQKFLFVFDFGDDHQFGIKVEGFGKVQKGKKYPLILEEKGKAPEQYPNYEE